MGKGKTHSESLWETSSHLFSLLLRSIPSWPLIVLNILQAVSPVNSFFIIPNQVSIGMKDRLLKRPSGSVLRGLLPVQALCSALKNDSLTQSSAGTQLAHQHRGLLGRGVRMPSAKAQLEDRLPRATAKDPQGARILNCLIT